MALVLGLLVGVVAVWPASPASAAPLWCTDVGYRVRLDGGQLDPFILVNFPGHSPASRVYLGGYEVGRGHWTCSMEQGSMSEAVRALQHDINACYAPRGIAGPVAADGEFGPRTRDALKQVQRFHRISDDGRYGRVTSRTILHRWYSSHPLSPPSGCETLAALGWPGDSG
jgi:hypothetical protein